MTDEIWFRPTEKTVVLLRPDQTKVSIGNYSPVHEGNCPIRVRNCLVRDAV
jgi:hypothetical protein